MESKLKIPTYNSQGSGTGRLDYIMVSHDTIFVQEHWLFNRQSHLFRNALYNVNFHLVSAMDDNQLYTGRPFGGCAVIWHHDLTASITPITCSTKGIYAVKMSFNNVSPFLCSVYMPTLSPVNVEEYRYTCIELSALIIAADFNYIIIGVDFNTSLFQSLCQRRH